MEGKEERKKKKERKKERNKQTNKQNIEINKQRNTTKQKDWSNLQFKETHKQANQRKKDG